MIKKHWLTIAALTGVVTVLGCETDTPPAAVSGPTAAMSVQQHSRLNTPWRAMGDAELAERVRQADGIVFIGFKNPGPGMGVSEQGRVLAARGSIDAAKSYLREKDIEILLDMDSHVGAPTPTVIARIKPELITELRRHPLIEYVEPNSVGEFTQRGGGQTTPWNIARVNAPNAWPQSSGSGAVLLILDSGIDVDHPDLAPSYSGACLGSDPNDNFGHGTAVAGIAAAVNNSIQIVGAAPDVSLWSIKVGDHNGPNATAMACGLWTGRIGGADVISLSVSMTPHTGITDQINMAYAEGILVVAAAGNDAGAVAYPAILDAAIAVSAVDTNNTFASFSNYGTKVEITAPGTTVTGVRGLSTTCIDGGVCSTIGGAKIQGTSFAAPHVAAAAAILRRTNYSWSHEEVRRRLRDGATDLGTYAKDNYYGYGLLNVTGAIAADPIVPPTYPSSPTVTITGTDGIRSGEQCSWFAQVTGGNPPFIYAWRINGVPAGNGTNELFYTNQGSDFTISVKVTDQLGIYDMDEHFVTVQSGSFCI